MAAASRSRMAGKARRRSRAFSATCKAAACDQFTTVLAPGSNQFHYDHIHVDLMRRASGRRICNPGAVDGDVVASLARKNPRYASSRPLEVPPTRHYDPPVEPGNDPFAWRGDARRGDPATTGAIAARRPGARIRRRKTSTGSRSPARGRPSTGARTSATRCFEPSTDRCLQCGKAGRERLKRPKAISSDLRHYAAGLRPPPLHGAPRIPIYCPNE